MKMVHGLALAFLVLATPAAAWAQEQTAEDITRALNGGPPVQASSTPVAPQPSPTDSEPDPQPHAASSESATQADADETGAPEAEAPAAPAAPAYVVLDADAVRALPFTLSLPQGFRITAGRSGPDFQVFTIRKDEAPFVMIYAGAQSFYPVYSGQEVEAGGRRSILTESDGRRRAVEHLFLRGAAPREIHVWVSSVASVADRDQAEAIAQSVDPR